MAQQKQGTSTEDLSCLTIEDLEQLSRDVMDKQTRDYYNEGSDSNSTLRENSSAYNKYRIRPRVLRDVSFVDSSVHIFGHRNSIPMGVAPTAMQKLAHSDGELGTARACKNMGVAMGLSSFATASLEEVAEASEENPRVLQLYLFEEREKSRELLNRAKKAGFKAVFLTVDTPFLGRRNQEIRNQFKLPPHLSIGNFPAKADPDAQSESLADGRSKPNTTKKRASSTGGYSDHAKGARVLPTGPITFHTHAANPTLNWESDIEWLKKECMPEMEVWLKGIATREDALLAIHHGVSGIVVSNHGGRQLNGALATIDALPEIVEAVQGRIPIHVDGGIRHGTDVFKALALGADFCWVGRPALWGLAYKGQQGVELMLKILTDEIRLCMSLSGTVKVSDINQDYLCRVSKTLLNQFPLIY